GPAVDQLVYLLPAAQVEVPDAEVRTVRQDQRLAKRRQEGLVDVVEDARHRMPGPRSTAPRWIKREGRSVSVQAPHCRDGNLPADPGPHGGPGPADPAPTLVLAKRVGSVAVRLALLLR